MNRNTSYDDIINLPHHTSKVRPRMSSAGRAAQFAPFSALTVHGDAIKETARLTDSKIELDEDEKQILDGKMRYITEHANERMCITVTYFVPDEKKSGGRYDSLTGSVKKKDLVKHCIVMQDGAEIPIDDIVGITFQNS